MKDCRAPETDKETKVNLDRSHTAKGNRKAETGLEPVSHQETRKNAKNMAPNIFSRKHFLKTIIASTSQTVNNLIFV